MTRKEKLDLLDSEFDRLNKIGILFDLLDDDIKKEYKIDTLKFLWYFYFFFYQYNDKVGIFPKNDTNLDLSNSNYSIYAQDYLEGDFDSSIPISDYLRDDNLLKFTAAEIGVHTGKNNANSNNFIEWAKELFRQDIVSKNWQDNRINILSKISRLGQELYEEIRKNDIKTIKPDNLEEVINKLKNTRDKDCIWWLEDYFHNGELEKHICKIEGKKKVSKEKQYKFISENILNGSISPDAIKKRFNPN